MIKKALILFSSFLSLLTPCLLAASSQLTVAVAANYALTLQEKAQQYQAQTGNKVTVISGATGKLYLQALHGAPFDLFFAADSQHPQNLIDKHLAYSDSLVTYATAELVLIANHDAIAKRGEHVLQEQAFHWLAIANPQLAPCGYAATEVLQHLKLDQLLKDKITYAENVNQTLSFVMSDAAELGLVTYSQVRNKLPEENIWHIPSDYYSPIIEQAVILKNTSDKELANDFLAFITKSK